MIGRYELGELLEQYGIDAKKVINNNTNVLNYGEYNEIKMVLDYLMNELHMLPKNIEKCPSVLYFKVDAIKENYQFLINQKVNISDIKTCLHVLSTEPLELKKHMIIF